MVALLFLRFYFDLLTSFLSFEWLNPLIIFFCYSSRFFYQDFNSKCLKMDQFYRWSTNDLINFLIISVWSISQKKNPLDLGCSFYVNSILSPSNFSPFLHLLHFSSSSSSCSSYTFMNLQYKNPLRKKNGITQPIINFSIQKIPPSSQTTQIVKPHNKIN